MSYRSRIDIKVPRIAEAEDPELNQITQVIYNALHLLNARLEQVTDELTSPGRTVPPTESVTFKSAWVPVSADHPPGRIVRPEDGTFILGATGHQNTTAPFGIVLDSINDGMCLIGFPIGAIEIEGETEVGAVIFSSPSGELTYNGEPENHWPVGQIIREGYAILYPSMAK